MADSIDVAQNYQAEMLARQIAAAIAKPVTPSAFFCEDCDTEIPQARRAMLPGVSRCVTCQEVVELKNKHYRGGL